MERILMAVGKAGLKPSGNPDILLVIFPEDVPAHFIFTKNRIRSGSVTYSEKALAESGGYVRVLFVNSGNANCSAGNTEDKAREIAEFISGELNIPTEKVLIFSTGVIGEPLPVDSIKSAVREALRNREPLNIKKASEVISTTDRFPKYCSYVDGNLKIEGFAKGAGMIHPDMATMLAFIITNAELSPDYLRGLVRDTGEKTFNSITVDGCTSTNDSFGVICMREIKVNEGKLKEGILHVAEDLAKKIVRDGEGATRIIRIRVCGAETERMAKDIAKSIAISPLVKTAVHGCDPNWGRIISAVGSAGYDIKEEDIEIFIGEELMFKGKPLGDRERAREYMLSSEEVCITVNLNKGSYEWTYFSSDLTCDYVKFNSEYTT